MQSILFNTANRANLVGICIYDWLEHDEKREKIAQTGYDSFLVKHTSSIRAKELLKVLEENT